MEVDPSGQEPDNVCQEVYSAETDSWSEMAASTIVWHRDTSTKELYVQLIL